MWQIVINGPGYFDTQYELPDGVTSVGRADENDIVLSGDLVSRRHARFHVKGTTISVEDLGSRNGSKVNGTALKGTLVLKVGDTVTVGENSMLVRQPASAETAATEMADVNAGGVRRYGTGTDISSSVVVAKNVSESVLLKALDNVLPFDPTRESPFSSEEPSATSSPISYPALLLLYKAAEKLATAESLQDFLDETTDRLLQQVNATTAVVLLRHSSGVLVPAAVRHRGQLAKGEVPVSDAIIEEALKKGAALAVTNVRDDQRFSQRESVILYGADQVLCVPVGHATQPEGFAGVLYLNRSGADPGGLEPMLDLTTAVGHLIATGVDKFKVQDTGRHEVILRRALERFHAPDIVERRAKELARQGGGRLTQMEEQTVTALFADIAGFTALTRKLSTEEVVAMLNEFYERMTGIIFSFEGTVDKFMGDAVMALFGAPYSKGDDALRAVRTALAMQEEWEKVMKPRPAKERCQLRIGLNTGKALAGTVGSEARLDFTAIGEPVNVASWLCASADPGQTLITGKTLAAIGARFDVTPLGERVLRAPKDKVSVFEVVDEDVGHHTHPGVT